MTNYKDVLKIQLSRDKINNNKLLTLVVNMRISVYFLLNRI